MLRKHIRKAAAATAALLLAACGTGAPAPTPAAPPSAGDAARHRAHVLSHGRHTGLAVPAGDLNERLPELEKRFPRAAYYELGWGDAGFYPKRDAGLLAGLHALFFSPASILHVAGLEVPPPAAFPTSEVLALGFTPDGYRRMLDRLAASFARDCCGEAVPLQQGLYGNSSFYAANGHYHLFNTCNTWTAELLAAGGVDTRPGRNLLSETLMRKVRPLAAARNRQPPEQSGLPVRSPSH